MRALRTDSLAADVDRCLRTPFGAYVPFGRGNLLFLILRTGSHEPKFLGTSEKSGLPNQAKALHPPPLGTCSSWRASTLGSLDKISRVARPGVSIAATGEIRPTDKGLPDTGFRDNVAGDVVAWLSGVKSLPLGVQVELEVTFEVSGGASVLESKPIPIETAGLFQQAGKWAQTAVRNIQIRHY